MRKGILLCGALAAGMLVFAQAHAVEGQEMVGDKTYTRIQHGLYLARAADCAACHTAEGGKPFAGGRPIPTPFGTIYSSNITPEKGTGIGAWSAEDFYHAMHEGRSRDKDHLYPAMPYPWYTRMTREDVDDIKAYLDTLAPVRNDVKAPELPWPLSWRGGMAIWNEMFFKPGGFRPNPDKSEQWNRGAYLVEGAGHCGACHTPKNALGAAKTNDRLAGGDAGEHWYAPSLAGDMHEGLGQWSVENIMEYLKTGATRNSAAAGTMVDVIRNSTRYLDDRDLRSIAVYLKDMPPDSHGNSRNDRKWNIDSRRMISGAALYQDHCAACHMENGEGLPDVFPSLGNSSAIQAKKPDTIVHLILQGGRMAGTPARPVQFGMPAFKDKLNDGQIADLATYVRNAWGNNAPPVGSAGVKAMRKTLNR